jgi:hypothetical protein
MGDQKHGNPLRWLLRLLYLIVLCSFLAAIFGLQNLFLLADDSKSNVFYWIFLPIMVGAAMSSLAGRLDRYLGYFNEDSILLSDLAKRNDELSRALREEYLKFSRLCRIGILSMNILIFLNLIMLSTMAYTIVTGMNAETGAFNISDILVITGMCFGLGYGKFRMKELMAQKKRSIMNCGGTNV